MKSTCSDSSRPRRARRASRSRPSLAHCGHSLAESRLGEPSWIAFTATGVRPRARARPRTYTSPTAHHRACSTLGRRKMCYFPAGPPASSTVEMRVPNRAPRGQSSDGRSARYGAVCRDQIAGYERDLTIEPVDILIGLLMHGSRLEDCIRVDVAGPAVDANAQVQADWGASSPGT